MARVCLFDVNETLLDMVGADLSEVANRILEVEVG
jgi:hypothetical protein